MTKQKAFHRLSGEGQLAIRFIYALIDPRNGSIRYVGMSTNPEQRLGRHVKQAISNAKVNPHKERWILGLIALGAKPMVAILAVSNEKDWPSEETYWIDFLKAKGEPLTNIRAGGKGGSIRCSEETRRRISESNVGRKQSPEAIRNQKAAQADPEWKARFSESCRNRPPISSEERTRRSEFMKNRTVTEETRRRMSLARRGKPMPEATRLAHLGSKRSAATRAKIGAATRRLLPYRKRNSKGQWEAGQVVVCQ